jgi:hypothetical protein
MKTIECDVCVIGAGSGGIGAAVGAAALGASTVVVEKNWIPGGTTTLSWVHTWEPCYGNSSLCEKLWNRMKAMPYGAEADYSLSNSAYTKDGRRCPPLPFEPWAFVEAAKVEMKEAGVKAVFYGTEFIKVTKDGAKIKSVICDSPGGALEIKAKIFIDSTANINLARQAGCAYRLGSDSKSDFNEEHAPEIADRKKLNKINFMFRLSPCNHKVEISDYPVPEEAQKKNLCNRTLPNGDIIANPCGHIAAFPEDEMEFSKSIQKAYSLAFEFYRWHVKLGNFKNYSFSGIAPEPGIRETYRLNGRYVLNENDLLEDMDKQRHSDIIAFCDHPIDAHGEIHQALENPYGIPYRCLLTKEFDNLLVACRGASFSHIAASSCRLSRTMTTLGEVAGKAAALSIINDKLPEDADINKIRSY